MTSRNPPPEILFRYHCEGAWRIGSFSKKTYKTPLLFAALQPNIHLYELANTKGNKPTKQDTPAPSVRGRVSQKLPKIKENYSRD
jgi:hypothetical protein